MSRRSHPVKVEAARRGLTLKQLAEAVHVSPGTLSQVLNEAAAPWPALKERTADYFGVPEAELWPDPLERLLAERVAQGWPATLEDPDVARRIAALLVTGTTTTKNS